MGLESILKSIVRSFFIIVSGILMASYIMCALFAPDTVFPISFFPKIFICAVVTDLPFFIFYSKRELSRGEMLVRNVIHFALLLSILLFLAKRWEWVDFSSAMQVVAYMINFISIYAAVYSVSYYLDRKLADKLNEGLKKRYH